MTTLENWTDGTRFVGLRERVARNAWLIILIADVGLLVWCLLAAVIPEHLPGPSSASIVRDGYEGFTGGSWKSLVDGSPATGDFIVLVFRMFGVYGTAFSLMAIAIASTAFRRGERWAWWALLIGNTIGYGGPMAYDLIVHAVGPFEMLEYLGIGLVYAALAVDYPGRTRSGPGAAQSGQRSVSSATVPQSRQSTR
jgi:hypothetical protein